MNMNDTLYEQLVVKKSKWNPMMVRIVMIIAVILFLTVGAIYLGFLSVVAAVILGLVSFFYIFPRLHTEYEYALLNHELDIAAIYNRSKRAELQSLDIQKAEVIAPIGSDKLSHFRPQKTYDYSSGTDTYKVYTIMIRQNNALCAIMIEPDEKMVRDIKRQMGSKFSEI